MQLNIFTTHPIFGQNEPLDFALIVVVCQQANRYGLVCPMNTEQCPYIDCSFFCIFKFILKQMVAYCIKSLIYNLIVYF